MLRSLLTLSIRPISVHPRLSEWHLSFAMFLSGLVFLFWDSFHIPAFEAVNRVAPDWVWGFSMIILGVTRIVVLYINGAWSRSPHLRSVLAAISSIVWMGLLTSLLAFSTPLLVVPFIFSAIIVDQISAFRAAQDARVRDENGTRNGPIT